MWTLGPIAFFCLAVLGLVVFATYVKHSKDKDDGLVFGFWAMICIYVLGSVIIGIALNLQP